MTKSANPAFPHRSLNSRRQVSILADAATIENPSTPHHFFLANCRRTLAATTVSTTPPTSQLDPRIDRVIFRTCLCLRFEICGDGGKKPSASIDPVDEPFSLQGLRCRAAATGDLKPYCPAASHTPKQLQSCPIGVEQASVLHEAKLLDKFRITVPNCNSRTPPRPPSISIYGLAAISSSQRQLIEDRAPVPAKRSDYLEANQQRF